MRSFMVLLLIFLCIQPTNSSVPGTNTVVVVCSEIERQALLSFKNRLQDPTNWLFSWIGDDNCCTWRGVTCNNRTGHVTKLNLRQPYDAAILTSVLKDPGNEQFDAYMSSLLGGVISPSLLDLQQLKYLDLSMKNFYRIRIPEFLGSLKSLRYLNLSNANFCGRIPHQLGNLSSLRFLDLSTTSEFATALHFVSADGTGLYAESLQWLSNLSLLQYLDMSLVNLTNAIDYVQVLNVLPSLKELFLINCKLNPSLDFPVSHVNFTSLTSIDLSDNYFISSAPEWLFGIRGLVSLQLSYNYFHGPIPCGLQNMTSLRILQLSHNSFNSTIPDWLYNMRSLVTLDISFNSLRGSIISAFGNLTSLSKIDLSGNELGGEIPTTLENLFKLQELYLYGNNLSGPLPIQLGQLKSLTMLDLSTNSISGPIPSSIGSLSSLRELDLSYNQLDGSIPESLGHLSKLEQLWITQNSLEGEVSEVHFANLTKLNSLYASSNSLVLRVASNWIPPFQLQNILLGSWHVGSQFPSWLQTQRNMSSLVLSYTRISGEIPTWFWNLSSQISYLNLSNNQLHGELPRRLKLDSIYSMIFLGSNNLEGPLPHISSNVGRLDLSNNSFSGPISHFLCQQFNGSSKLEILDLSNNLLFGDIPDCWMRWHLLQAINLGNNNLTGEIPNSLGSLFALQSLHLDNNHLYGTLPSCLQNLSLLQLIDLSKNKFSGSIPTWIGKSLQNLIVLVINSNNFGGSIPPKLCDLSSLRILDLAHNNLSGPIPQCFKNFSSMATKRNLTMSSSQFSYLRQLSTVMFMYYGSPGDDVWLTIKGNELRYGNLLLKLLISIDLSDNHLFGEIPKEMTSLVGLQSLNLSRNHLTGNIPEKIGEMLLLESLDLSTNRLFGGIPESMSHLTFLSVLNLSYNSLSGSIPLSTQLQSFNASSFMGNTPQLCGPPLTQNCTGDWPNDDIRRVDKGSFSQIEEFYISMALGFVFGFWGLWGPLLFKKSWRFAYFQFLTKMIDKCFG